MVSRHMVPCHPAQIIFLLGKLSFSSLFIWAFMKVKPFINSCCHKPESHLPVCQ